MQLGTCDKVDEISSPITRILELPKRETFVLGAYPDAIIYYDHDLTVMRAAPPLVKKFFDRFPNANILVLKRDDDALSFGYAIYDSGKLVRAASGSRDDDIAFNFGGYRLPAEAAYFEKAFMRDGKAFTLSSKEGKEQMYTCRKSVGK